MPGSAALGLSGTVRIGPLEEECRAPWASRSERDALIVRAHTGYRMPEQDICRGIVGNTSVVRTLALASAL